MTREKDIRKFIHTLRARAPDDAAELLAREPPELVREALSLLPDNHARRIAEHLPQQSRISEFRTTGQDASSPGSLAELMEPIPASVSLGATVAAAIEAVRRALVPTDVTYLYVIDENDHLVGLVVMIWSWPAPTRLWTRSCCRNRSGSTSAFT